MTRIRTSFLATSALILGLAACTEPVSQPNNTTTGALVGAGFGAIAGRALGGNDKGERNRATVAGAAIGAAAGAAIGSSQ